MQLNKWLIFLVCVLVTDSIYAITKSIEFVACPIYRDTRDGRKSGCWLSDDPSSGIRYDVSKSPSKPDYNYKVLVEGIVSDEQDDACGGVVLEPVRVSVLDEHCPAFKLEENGYPGRKFLRTYRSLMPKGHDYPPFEESNEDRTFSILYDFNKAFVVYEFSDYLLDRARRWLLQAKPNRIIVTGYADVLPRYVSGVEIAEDPEIAKERAAIIVLSLTRLGIDPSIIEMRTSLAPQSVNAEEVNGLLMSSKRRVDIRGEFD